MQSCHEGTGSTVVECLARLPKARQHSTTRTLTPTGDGSLAERDFAGGHVGGRFGGQLRELVNLPTQLCCMKAQALYSTYFNVQYVLSITLTLDAPDAAPVAPPRVLRLVDADT